jgi:hypothetical protein
MKKFFFLVVVLTGLYACRPQPERLPDLGSDRISRVVAQMTDLMVHDISNPPLAARFYAYACLAGYEVVSRHDSTCPLCTACSTGIPGCQRPIPAPTRTNSVPLLAMRETALKMQPSGPLLDNYQQSLLDSCRRAGFPTR